jgi:hypothetical protein
MRGRYFKKFLVEEDSHSISKTSSNEVSILAGAFALIVSIVKVWLHSVSFAIETDTSLSFQLSDLASMNVYPAARLIV